MTRLQSALQGLYLTHSPDGDVPCAENASLIDADGQVRAMALALSTPADWAVLSVVWRGVQDELSLPAPAIAVSGLDGLQLWFSLEEAVQVAEAHAFLNALRERYLSDVAPPRIGLMPSLDANEQSLAWPVSRLPGQEVRTGQWSAFVAPDLAPIFVETPWIDIPPNREGQADLLSRVQQIKPTTWRMARAKLRPVPASASAGFDSSAVNAEAKRFLRNVMNDDTVALALRIEAAKALLPFRE